MSRGGLSTLVRRGADAAFGLWARQHVTRLDRLDLARAQEQTLLRLVRRAGATRFGREHGFESIRSVRDYQRRVPLRTYDAFWHDYWRPAFPGLRDVTWPGETPYLALSSGTTCGATKYLPVTRAMLRAQRRAALTSLAWFRAAHPQTPLLTGKLFFLGGSTALERPAIVSGRAAAARTLAGDLSGIVAATAPALARPFAFPPPQLALVRDWEAKLDQLARQSLGEPITMLSGVPSWMLVLMDRLRQLTGRATLAEVWPQLRLVIHGGTKFDPYRALFRERIGSDAVRFQETYPASEGFVAAEDPRHGLLRLVPDPEMFFEFVPVGQLSADRPERHTVAEIVPGVQYAVVLTTCAGLWSYVLGDTVCFERRDPPLLRFTGRTAQFLSAFGEHVIGEEVEASVAEAAEATRATVVDFHVGPVFPDGAVPMGRHRYLVEFAAPPCDLAAFVRRLDAALAARNDDYRAHRAGDLTMGLPEVWCVPRGGFAAWMKSRGKLGGQHKVPRMDHSGAITDALSRLFAAGAHGELSRTG